MRKAWLAVLAAWLVASPAQAASMFDPQTQSFDYCMTVRTEDGTVEADSCLDILEVTDGTLTDNGDGTLTLDIGGGGDATAWDDIADPDAAATIAFAGHQQDITSTLDSGNVLEITNTDADAAADTILLKLAHNDGADANVIYARFTGDADGTPTNDYSFTQTGATFLLDLTVPTEAYDATGWNSDLTVPTKDTIRDKLEAMPQTAGRSLTLSTTTIDADAELYTHTKSFWWENPVAGDDFKSVWINDTGSAITVTKLWAESDQTVTLMLQVDDGTPADMDSVDLVAISTPDTDTSLDGDATIANGDRVDVDVASVSGTPTWVSIAFTYTKDD